MQKLSEQLEIFGVNEVVRRIEMEPVRPSERRRLLRRVEVIYDMMTELPVAEDMSFLHSGLCQTCLPHSRPPDDRDVWRRSSGRFSLIITPGVVDDFNLSGPGFPAAPGVRYVGVPYGSRAWLVTIQLQTEGVKSRRCLLGDLSPPISGRSAFLYRAALVAPSMLSESKVSEFARCGITMQWSNVETDGSSAQ